MSDQRIKIPRAADRALLTCFKELAKLTGTHQVTITALGFNNLGTIDLTSDYPEVIKLIVKKNSAIIETISLNILGLPVSFHRGGNYQPQDKSGVFDEIVIRQNTQQGNLESEVTIELISIINRKLKAFDPKRSVVGATEEQAQFAAIHNSNIERLEALNEELVKKTHDYRLQLDQEFNEKSVTLEKEIQKKGSKVDENYRKKEQILESGKEELELKRKELDDSSNTHARREIRRDILKEIKSRQTKFALTEGTNKLRAPIAITMFVLIAIFLGLTVISAFEFYKVLQGNDLNKIIVTGIKQAIYSAGAIGSVIFMIRWMNRWFELHSQSEFALKKFELDMERASWLVETSLEWKDAKGTAIPTELLESLSKNLFTREGDKVEQIQHPADQLASALLGSASSVKLQSGESSLEIDPKKLAKSKLVGEST